MPELFSMLELPYYSQNYASIMWTGLTLSSSKQWKLYLSITLLPRPIWKNLHVQGTIKRDSHQSPDNVDFTWASSTHSTSVPAWISHVNFTCTPTNSITSHAPLRAEANYLPPDSVELLLYCMHTLRRWGNWNNYTRVPNKFPYSLWVMFYITLHHRTCHLAWYLTHPCCIHSLSSIYHAVTLPLLGRRQHATSTWHIKSCG